MRQKWHFKSVRTRQVFWFLIVALVPLFTLVTLLYYQRPALMKRREFEKLQTLRDLKVRELNHWIDERTGDLAVAASDWELRVLEQVLALDKATRTSADKQALGRVRRLLQRLVASYDAYSEFFLVNVRSGEVAISSTPAREGLQRGKRAFFTDVMRTKRQVISDIYYSKTEGRPSMTFSMPVFCIAHRRAHLSGVLVARIDLEHSLYPVLLEHTGYGKTGETLIVDRNVIAVGKLRWRDNTALKLKISAKPAVRAARGETGITETPDYRGEMVLAAYTHIPRTRWGFVAKRDFEEIYAPIRGLMREMAIMLAISALLALLVALFLGRIVARPLVAIAAAAGRIRQGDLEARCEVDGADEIASLALAFNQMADTVVSQMGVQGAGAAIANTTVAATSVGDFASALVAKLMQLTCSNIGAFYQRDSSGRTFAPIASIALKTEALQSFDAESQEGELGLALASRSICYTSNIDHDTVFSFKAVAGTAMPRELVTIPLLVGRDVAAVVALATLGNYTTEQRLILEQAWIGLNTALSNLLASEQTAQLAEELQAKNAELQSQTEELLNQTEELEAQREEVEQADRLKSEFLSNMSHELRTPLNSVLALSQLMLTRGLGKDLEQEAEYLRVIERNGRQLLDLINDILDLSKIEAGQQEVLLADVEPGEVAAAALATVGPLAQQEGLEATFRASEGLPRIVNDRTKIRQILLNLLSNALKFTDEGGVELAVSRTAKGVAFAVTDTGLGIDQADLASIFDAFRQLDGSTTRAHGGTGLGLSISRRLARLLGGELTVESQPGKGSTFTLTLPLECPRGVSLPAAGGLSRPERRATFEGTPRVLVVEDNKIAAIQIKNVLEDHGCDVAVAAGGAEGIAAVRAALPDVMVLDLMMPDVDGFTVLEQIRSIPEAERLPVLVLTAKELTAEDRACLTHNNVVELIQKGSLNREELVERVVGLIAAHAGSEPAAEPVIGRGVSEIPAGTTILVVEDNADNRLTITALLDEMGVEHATAEDGEQAVRVAKELHPDLILMDMHLPVLSGLDATQRIKATPELEKTPVIALTARAMIGDREEILAAGCDDYLSKPIDPALLRETIRKWLLG